PIALIDEHTPTVALAPSGPHFEKTASNVQEVMARKGRTVLISDSIGLADASLTPDHAIEAPECDPFVAPIVYAAPVQLIAYQVAVEKGTDVDQPRNLAKSVTVE
ncbi:MAG: glutamine--fructose-6-phosphate aminotransferase, partial [Caulobacterales bacterium]|nr:glutamine--fructose-6-phosphate aminotransferase [Caulobacterales bacterium]